MTIPSSPHASVSAVVEGIADEAVIRRLVSDAGGQVGAVYGKRGKQWLLSNAPRYNEAARFGPWLVLVDLNGDESCGPPAVEAWMPSPGPLMCFRVAVRAVEAWLLADRARLARFLRVQQAHLPADPESVENPKRLLVDIARGSSSRAVARDMVPIPRSGTAVGVGYTSRIVEFVSKHWHPEDAASSSNSLARCLTRVGELLEMQP